MNGPELPGVLLALLRRAAGPMAEEVEGDLHESMHGWARREGAARARRRGMWTAARMIPALALGRLREGIRRRAGRTGWTLDARLALRLLRRNPGLSLVSVVALGVTMALAIGVFTFVGEAMYADLPVEAGDRIVALELRDEVTRRQLVVTHAEARAWREGATTFDHTGAFNTERFTISVDGVPMRDVAGARITPSLFQFAAPAPVAGTVFTDEMVAAEGRLVVLRESVWADQFGSDPDLIGADIELAGVPHRVVGIMPAEWAFPSDQSLWVPLTFPVTADPSDHHAGTYLVGRLATGVSVAAATLESRGLIRSAPPLSERTPEVTVHGYARAFFDPGVEAVMAAAILALVALVLVAAANVANLVLARTESRREELAVRSALGASRLRIVGQLFVEALALTSVGALLALLLVTQGFAWLRAVVVEVPYYIDLGVDPLALGFATTLALLAAVVAGAVPALRATRDGMVGGGRGSAGSGFGRFGQGVIVVELAVSVAMLGCAFAVGESFLGYVRGGVVDLPGEEVLTATLYLPWEGERADTGDIATFSPALRRAVRASMVEVVGSDRISFALDLPGAEAQGSRAEVEGIDGVHSVRGVSTDHGLFEVVDVAPEVGRTFSAADVEPGAARVVVVNRPFVDDVLGGRNAIGRRIRFHYGEEAGEWSEIVGVVPDLGHNPGDRTAASAVYRPIAGANYLSVLLRPRPGAARTPQELLPALRAAVFAFDPEVQVRDAGLLSDAGSAERAALSGVGAALFALGAMALMLSAAGLYAVLSFAVARRTREIGVRIALGASRARITASVGRRVAAGLALGLLGGGLAGAGLLRVIETFPFEVRVDPLLHLGVPGVLLVVVGALSVLPPLLRALSIQPAEALRAD